jgi:hypothetical protein
VVRVTIDCLRVWETAITNLEGSSPILSALGTAVFDLTLNALTSTQPTI